MVARKKSIAVSMGEPAGVGPDVILTAWNKRREFSLPPFTVIGDVSILRQRAKLLNITVDIETVPNENTLCVLPVSSMMKCTAGSPESGNSKGVIEAIRRGVEGVKNGEFSALTTCPINKKVLYDAGFEFAGHTEYLAELAQSEMGKNYRAVMMLAGPQLRSVPVTIHIALDEVKTKLTRKLIVETGRIVAQDLKQKFGIADPVLAVAGVNPHAGEEGAMGRDEIDIIVPAIDGLRAHGIKVEGPFPADTMFHQRARQTYDVAICMYHDQALIPAKTLGFDDAVNVTLGLPFIRTSPDHGTAFDLAGTGKARPDSFVAALKMADEMAAHQGENH